MNRISLFVPNWLALAAVVLMACQATRNAGESHADDLDNVESIGIEKTENDIGQLADNHHSQDDSDHTEKRVQDIQDLAGNWIWVKTACCGRMMGETFPAEGEPDRVISFDQEGNARYFTDETREKVSTVPYKVGSLGPNQPTVRIGELQPAIFEIENDTLILSWGYMDLQVEYYKRQSGD
jgi:hypothetical protein